MKFKTTILLPITARADCCHSQCCGLVDIGEKPKTEWCCSVFRHEVLHVEKRGILRSKKCLSAQSKAHKVGIPLVDALYEILDAFCKGDEWIGVPVRDNAIAAIDKFEGK